MDAPTPTTIATPVKGAANAAKLGAKKLPRSAWVALIGAGAVSGIVILRKRQAGAEVLDPGSPIEAIPASEVDQYSDQYGGVARSNGPPVDYTGAQFGVGGTYYQDPNTNALVGQIGDLIDGLDRDGSGVPQQPVIIMNSPTGAPDAPGGVAPPGPTGGGPPGRPFPSQAHGVPIKSNARAKAQAANAAAKKKGATPAEKQTAAKQLAKANQELRKQGAKPVAPASVIAKPVSKKSVAAAPAKPKPKTKHR